MSNNKTHCRSLDQHLTYVNERHCRLFMQDNGLSILRRCSCGCQRFRITYSPVQYNESKCGLKMIFFLISNNDDPLFEVLVRRFVVS